MPKVFEDGINQSSQDPDIEGLTASVAELNKLDGATLTTAEMNILAGALLSTTELNYVKNVTSALQAQIDAIGGGKLTVLGDYEATGAESSKTFTFTAIDFNDVSMIIVIIDGEATASFALQMKIDAFATNYFIDGEKSVNGTSSTIDINTATEWELIPSTSIGADNPITTKIYVFLSKGATNPRTHMIGLSYIGGSFVRVGGQQLTSNASITDIIIKTSTSTWKTGTRITVYKLARS